MLLAGIDEAGRGSLLGPLVIACVVLKDDDITLLKGLGVKDSKRLSKKRRMTLADEISKIAHHILIREISAREIDARRSTLNMLEFDAMIELIDGMRCDAIYIDSFDVKPSRLERMVKERLKYDATIHAMHKADRDIPIVSAASIIAKVSRDKAIDEIRCYGEIGSGYPSDPYTRSFISSIKDRRYDFIRYTWKSARHIV